MATDTESCPICIDKYTGQVRKKIKCQYCEFVACAVCLKRYLLESFTEAHCMECKREWNDEFLDIHFTKAFRTGPWKKHREKILFDREMSILPTRQPRVEATIKLKEVKINKKKLHDEIAEIEAKRQEAFNKLNRVNAYVVRYTAESEGREPPQWTYFIGDPKRPVEEKVKFVMRCPDTDCRGFLSTAYKCGTCQKWACSDCLEIKGLQKDSEHTCNDEKKASVALIIKESKPCPKCGERISKLDGCDQMWCVECQTSFSWKTGEQVTGVIHNPHYYEYIRKHGGVVPRNPGDLVCGGIPNYYALYDAFKVYSNRNQLAIINDIHRITIDIQNVRLHTYQTQFNINDNGDLGVKYLMKEIDQDKMKADLVKRETKRNKHLAIRAVLEMFVETSTILLNKLVNHLRDTEHKDKTSFINEVIEEFTNLRNYANESLIRISKMKNCSVPQIGNSSDNWKWIPFAKYTPLK